MILVVYDVRTRKEIGELSIAIKGIDLEQGTEGWYEVKSANKWLGQIHLKVSCDEATLQLKKESERRKSVRENRIQLKATKQMPGTP